MKPKYKLVEAVSKLLKIAEASLLQPVKGSVFAVIIADSSRKLPFAALCNAIIIILGENFFNAIVILSIVKTLPIPTLVRAVLACNKQSFEETNYHVPGVVKEDNLL